MSSRQTPSSRSSAESVHSAAAIDSSTVVNPLWRCQQQQEGEDQQTLWSRPAVRPSFWQRKAKEYPISNPSSTRSACRSPPTTIWKKGIGNPTFWTVERTAKALGLSVWDMLGIDQKVMRAWLAGQNIDLDNLSQSVESRRQARMKFSADEFAIIGAHSAGNQNRSNRRWRQERPGRKVGCRVES